MSLTLAALWRVAARTLDLRGALGGSGEDWADLRGGPRSQRTGMDREIVVPSGGQVGPIFSGAIEAA
jgi:hypothetical protein